MKYTYKVVSVDEFVRGEGSHSKGKAIGADKAFLATEDSYASNMRELLDYLLNYFADDGWEYWQTAEFNPQSMKTTGAKVTQALVGKLSSSVLGAGTGGALNNEVYKYPMVIFRKSMTDEEFDLIKEEREKEYKERWTKKTEPQLTTEELDVESSNYGITFDGEKYCYKDYKYDKLQDAIAYAKKNP